MDLKLKQKVWVFVCSATNSGKNMHPWCIRVRNGPSMNVSSHFSQSVIANRNQPMWCGAAPRKGPQGSEQSSIERKRRIQDKVLTPLESKITFCILCGTGDARVVCPQCDGKGQVLTRPGGAGVAGKVGTVRCKICAGSGVVPCAICGGFY